MGDHEALPTGDVEPENDALPTVVDTVHDVRPEPVLDAAALAAKVTTAIFSLGAVLKALGIALPSDLDVTSLASQAGNLVIAVAAAWAIIGPMYTALRARGKVTPLADPVSATGERLTPAGT